MLKINEGQCGMCAHFGESHPDDEKLVQIRINGEAPEEFVDECGHPKNAAMGLQVSPIGTCAGFEPVRRSA